MKFLALAFLAVCLGMFVTGCATTQTENSSERPWNAQRGWEHGLPSSINEGR